MKTKVTALIVLSVVGMVLALSLPGFAQTSDAGKKVFTDNKCNMCHSVESQGVTKTMASSKAPDLSNAGATHDAAWFTKYLKKETDLDGKKHVKPFTGKDEDLKALVDWLATLKKAAK